jgi:hypothetical protein
MLFSKKDHLEPLRKRVLAANARPAPPPWRMLPQVAVGGLAAVGFDESGNYFLVVSSSGRGLFDCKTGERVARDNSPVDAVLNARRLECQGIGPVSHENIRVAGIDGGGLPTAGHDGWSIECLPLNWPDVHVLLLGPGQSIYSTTSEFTKLVVEREVRAAGFSPVGNVLAVATSSDFTLWRAA